jgi:predicted RNA methylase
MLRDLQRNEAYRLALAHAVKPGDVVLDVGAGTGILSIFAAQAGARKVYAVERSAIAEVARRMVERNHQGAVIEVIQSDLEDLALPEKVDVIVSEWMGGFGVDENMLSPVVMARDRWLKPGGRMVPARVTAHLAPAEIPDFDEAIAYWRSSPHGVDTSVIATLSTQETYHTQTHLTEDNLLAVPRPMWSHDPHVCTLDDADQPFTAKLEFTAARAGMLSGLVAWFTAEMGDGRTLTTEVGAPNTHWGRTLFPLDRPIELAAGTTFEVELHCDPSVPGNCEFYWSCKLAGRPLEQHDTRAHRRARY